MFEPGLGLGLEAPRGHFVVLVLVLRPVILVLVLEICLVYITAPLPVNCFRLKTPLSPTRTIVNVSHHLPKS